MSTESRLLRHREQFWGTQDALFPRHMIQVGLDFLATPSRNTLLTIDADPNAFKALFKVLRETEDTATLSRPRLSSVLVGLTMLVPLEKSIEELMPNGNTHMFITLHDFAVGLRGATGLVSSGEASLRGNLEEEIREQFEAKMDSPIYGLGEDIKIYLSMTANAERARELLEKDPTGFILYDDYVNRVKDVVINQTTTSSIGSHIPEFVLAGAELGRDMYKMLYPLSE